MLMINKKVFILFFAFFAVASFAVFFSAGESNPWVHMTTPLTFKIPNSILGYSYLLNMVPIHKENVPTLGVVYMLSGGEAYASIYSVRAGYALLASMFAGFTGTLNACLTVNFLMWMASCACAYFFTKSVSGSPRAGVIAFLLALFGSGYWYHIHDYSAHLTSFTAYWIGACLIYRSGAWSSPQPVRVHIELACYFTFIAFIYNTAIILLFTYIVVSLLARNRAIIVLPLSAAVVVLQRLWPVVMQLSNDGKMTDLYATESWYLTSALENWYRIFDIGNLTLFFSTILKFTISFLMYEPITIAAAFIMLPVFYLSVIKKKKSGLLVFYLSLLFLMPIISALVWAPNPIARSYIIYCGSISIYIILACAFDKLFENKKIYAATIFSILLVGQAFWVSASIYGFKTPLSLYMMGGNILDDYERVSKKTEVLSLTDLDKIPEIANGNVKLAELTSNKLPSFTMRSPSYNLDSVKWSIIQRAYLLLPLFLLVLCALVRIKHVNNMRIKYKRIRKTLLCGFLFLWIFPAIANPYLMDEEYTFHSTHDHAVNNVNTITYEIILGEKAIKSIKREIEKGLALSAFVSMLNLDLGPRKIDILLDGNLLGQAEVTSRGGIPLDAKLFYDTVMNGSVLTVKTSSKNPGLKYGGWQSARLPNRKFYLDGKLSNKELTLPVVELRMGKHTGFPGWYSLIAI